MPIISTYNSYGVARISRLLKITGLFSRYRLFYRALLQKRPIILSIVLTEATPWSEIWRATCTSDSATVQSDSRVCCSGSVLQWVAVCCSVLQCVAVCCRVLQCVAECCRVLQSVEVCCSVLQCVAVCCSVLRCVAVCCSVLQCVAVCCSVLQCAAVCYSVLQ